MIQGLTFDSSRPSVAMTGKKHQSITIDEEESANSRNISNEL